MDNGTTQHNKPNCLWLIPADMQLSEVQNTVLELLSPVNVALSEGFDLCKELIDRSRDHFAQQCHILRMLLDSCHLTSESVLILVGNLKSWDADVLTRSVVEGTIKFAYMSYGSKEEIEQKILEYTIELPDIASIKRHQRLEGFLSTVEDPDSLMWKPFKDMLLLPEELQGLQGHYPRKYQQALRNKWSFHSLINTISLSGVPELKDSLQLFYGYGMSSHVLHQDADGIGMICDRNNRDIGRRDSIEVAHSCRLLSDILSMNLVRFSMCKKFGRLESEQSDRVFDIYKKIHEELNQHYQRWAEIEYGDEVF